MVPTVLQTNRTEAVVAARSLGDVQETINHQVVCVLWDKLAITSITYTYRIMEYGLRFPFCYDPTVLPIDMGNLADLIYLECFTS